MWILVFREQWSKFCAWFSFDHGAGDVLSFALLAVFFLERSDDQGPHGHARLGSAVAQSFVQGFGDVYRRSDRHDFIMAPMT